MLFEYGKHGALIICCQVEKAVPCQDRIEAPTQIESAHILVNPSHLWEAVSAQFEHRRRGINSRYLESFFDEETGNRLSATASKVENVRILPQPAGHLAQIFSLHQGPASIFVESRRKLVIDAMNVGHQDRTFVRCNLQSANAR